MQKCMGMVEAIFICIEPKGLAIDKLECRRTNGSSPSVAGLSTEHAVWSSDGKTRPVFTDTKRSRTTAVCVERPHLAIRNPGAPNSLAKAPFSNDLVLAIPIHVVPPPLGSRQVCAAVLGTISCHRITAKKRDFHPSLLFVSPTGAPLLLAGSGVDHL